MSEVECLVCQVEMAKARVHYGGISCYSCRAFFRRTTQRDDLVRCKLERKCSIQHQERKSCPPCRYEKCLRAGMRPDLVLDEDEKKRRFKKLVSKEVTEDSDSEEREVQIIHDGSRKTKKTIDNSRCKKKRSKSPNKSTQYSASKESLKKICSIRLPWPQDDSDDHSDDWLPLPSEVITDDDEDNSSDCQNDSFLDPETGQVIDNKENQATHTQVVNDATEDLQPIQKEETHENIINYPQEIIKDECDYESDIEFCSVSHKRNCSGKDCFPLSGTSEASKYQSVSSTSQIGDDPSGDDQIIKHIQNKFEKNQKFMNIVKKDSSSINQYVDNKHSIKKIMIYKNSQPQRKSVIVRREEAESEIKIEVQLKNETIVENRDRCEATEFVVSLDIKEIENIFTIEEGKYFDNVRAVFNQNWNMIPFGEEMLTLYINFCKQRHQLPVRFFQLLENQLKERILSFICSEDDLNKLPKSKQFSLLKKNLPEASMLVKVLGFNMRSWEEELDFVFTTVDMDQFRAQSCRIGGVGIGEIFRYSPFPDCFKKNLINILSSCAHPILGDQSVFILILLLVIFHDPQDPAICHIHEQYLTMLRRHLARRDDCCMGVEFLMNTIQTCLRHLPVMAQPFRQI